MLSLPVQPVACSVDTTFSPEPSLLGTVADMVLMEKLHKEVSQGDLASEAGRVQEDGHTAKHNLAEKQVWSWILYSGLTPGDGLQVS